MPPTYTQRAGFPTSTTSTTLGVTTIAIGDRVFVGMLSPGLDIPTAIADSNGRITWDATYSKTGESTDSVFQVTSWLGTVISVGATIVQPTCVGLQEIFITAVGLPVTYTTPWTTVAASIASGASTTAKYPSMTSGTNGGAYVGYIEGTDPTSTNGTPPGFTYVITADGDGGCFNGALAANTTYQGLCSETDTWAAVGVIFQATGSGGNTFLAAPPPHHF